MIVEIKLTINKAHCLLALYLGFLHEVWKPTLMNKGC